MTNQSIRARGLKLRLRMRYGAFWTVVDCDCLWFSGRASTVPPFTEPPSTLSQWVISLTVAAFLLSPAERYDYVSATYQVLFVFSIFSFIALLLVIRLD